MTFRVADLFCGAGGTSTGAIEALQALGKQPELTAVNHWPVAVATHELNHPSARHFCVNVDDLVPSQLFPEGLDLLWASPACTHHSTARGGKPRDDQSRATAWCVVRWAESVRPKTILLENVPEFMSWGPLDDHGKPIQSKKGATFHAWLSALKSLGYRVDHRILCAADYGDPTTRKRIFVQAVLGNRRIVWPDPTHTKDTDMFGDRLPWVSAKRGVIDWDIPTPAIDERKRPLAPATLKRIAEGLKKFGGEGFLVCMEHKGSIRSIDLPVPTVTTAKGGAIGVASPFLVSYYGNGQAVSVDDPLDTVTTKDRFGLVQPSASRIGFRMLQPHELAAAQGFRRDYQFSGTKVEQVKQIGNAVPRSLARAIVAAAIGQDSDVSWLHTFQHHRQRASRVCGAVRVDSTNRAAKAAQCE